MESGWSYHNMMRCVVSGIYTFQFFFTYLFEDGSYYFEAASPAIHKNSNVKVLRTVLRITEMWSKNKQSRCLRTKPRTSSAMFLPRTNNRSQLAIVVTPTYLCSHMCAARAATISFAELQVRLLSIRGRLLFRVWLLFEKICYSYYPMCACASYE